MDPEPTPSLSDDVATETKPLPSHEGATEIDSSLSQELASETTIPVSHEMASKSTPSPSQQGIRRAVRKAQALAIQTRNFTHYAQTFPPNTTPDLIERNSTHLASVSNYWTFATCPCEGLCPCCDEYNHHAATLLVISISGSCRGTGTPAAKVGMGIFFGVDNPLNLLGGLKGPEETVQTAELRAAVKALESIMFHITRERDLKDVRAVVLKTDSVSLVGAMTESIAKWKKNGYKNAAKKPVKNKELFVRLEELVETMEDGGIAVVFWFVGREYNGIAEVMAKAALDQP